MARIAFYTFGVQLGSDDDPVMKGFVDGESANFQAAESNRGFIDRSGYGEPDRPMWGAFDHPRFFRGGADNEVAMTLSLWRDLESVFAFAYFDVHAEALSHGRDWFVKPEWPPYVAWWVADDYRPDWSEAKTKLEGLHDNGPSPQAFNFKSPFGPEGAPTRIDRAAVRENRQSRVFAAGCGVT